MKYLKEIYKAVMWRNVLSVERVLRVSCELITYVRDRMDVLDEDRYV